MTDAAGAPRLAPRPGSPAARGYRMPAEWEPHRATWLVWPHNPTDWAPKTAAVKWCFAEIARLLSRSEAVCLLLAGPAAEARARRQLQRSGVDPGRIETYRVPTDRAWLRDSGPIFIVREQPDLARISHQPSVAAADPLAVAGRTPSRRFDVVTTTPAASLSPCDPPQRRLDGLATNPGEICGLARDVAVTDWEFNGWGRFPACRRDNRVPAQIAARRQFERFAARVAPATGEPERSVVLEGGAIDVDGAGTLLATEQCLLGQRQTRNPGLGRRDMEQALCDLLGVRQVLWLGRGLAGDDTHGHVDGVARFVAPGVVVAAVEPDATDENHEPLADNLRRLTGMTNARGAPLRVVEIPMPAAVRFGGRRLPASYLNFYIANRCVLVPTFNDPRDRIALALLAPLFPGREVVGIHAIDLVLGNGAVHCVTLQEPAAAP